MSFLFWAAVIGWGIVIIQNFKLLRALIEWTADKFRGK